LKSIPELRIGKVRKIKKNTVKSLKYKKYI